MGKQERQVKRESGDRETPSRPQEVKKIPKPVNLQATGLLAQEGALKNGVPLKWTVPPEARRPTTVWKLFTFKTGDSSCSKTIRLDRQRSFLLGNDVRVVDIPMMHPTISKQHAVIVHRLKGEDIKPYIIDLDSTNGTFLNDMRIDGSRYYELKPRDVIRLAKSTREFVVLPESLVETKPVELQEVLTEKLREYEPKG